MLLKDQVLSILHNNPNGMTNEQLHAQINNKTIGAVRKAVADLCLKAHISKHVSKKKEPNIYRISEKGIDYITGEKNSVSLLQLPTPAQLEQRKRV